MVLRPPARLRVSRSVTWQVVVLSTTGKFGLNRSPNPPLQSPGYESREPVRQPLHRMRVAGTDDIGRTPLFEPGTLKALLIGGAGDLQFYVT